MSNTKLHSQIQYFTIILQKKIKNKKIYRLNARLKCRFLKLFLKIVDFRFNVEKKIFLKQLFFKILFQNIFKKAETRVQANREQRTENPIFDTFVQLFKLKKNKKH